MVANGLERLAFAEDLALEAGRPATSFPRRDDLVLNPKGVLGWVTQADLAIEELIRKRVEESFGHEWVVGEEGGPDKVSTRAANRACVAELWNLVGSGFEDGVPPEHEGRSVGSISGFAP